MGNVEWIVVIHDIDTGNIIRLGFSQFLKVQTKLVKDTSCTSGVEKVSGVLEGVKVLDLSRILAGPILCTNAGGFRSPSRPRSRLLGEMIHAAGARHFWRMEPLHITYHVTEAKR